MSSWFEDAYEFDAPQFYDFNRTSLGCSQASLWFDQQQELAADEIRSPLAEVTSNVLSQERGSKKTAPVSTQTKKSNIVTSWGDVSTGKRVNASGVQKGHASSAKAMTKAPPVRSEPPVTRSAMKKRQAIQEADARGLSELGEGRHPLFKLAAVDEPVAENAVPMKPAPSGASDGTRSRQPRKQWQKMIDLAQEQQPEPSSEIAPPHEWPKLAAENPAPAPPRKLRPRKARSKTGIAVGNTKQAARNASGAAATTSGTAKPACAATTVTTSSRLLKPIGGVKVRRSAQLLAGSKGPSGFTKPGGGVTKIKKGLLASKLGQARSTKPLTLPDEIELHTSKRLRPEDHPSEANNKTPFKSLVNKVKEFQSKTPARFKTKPGPAPEHKPLTHTTAKTPLLWTTTRTRPSGLKPREEREAEEIAAQPQFKARAIGEGVPATVYKARETSTLWAGPTQAQPFHFVTDDRAEAKRRRLEAQQKREQDEARHAEFKANRLNKHILDGPMGLPEKHHLSCTIPKSPCLRTRLRGHTVAPVEEPKFEFKALPMPSFLDVPKGPAFVPAPLTQPEPFMLGTEARGKKHEEVMKAKLTEMEREAQAARNFRAMPIGHNADKPLSRHRHEPKELTDPRPFNLRSETRHQQYAQSFAAEQQMKEELEKAEAAFKARAVPQTHRVPYTIATESDRPLTVPEDVRLTTDMRAVQREAFDREVEEKMRQAELEKQRLDEEKVKEEQRERLAIRRAARFKARPMPDYSKQKPLAPPQSKPATKAITPTLGQKRRRQTNFGA